VTPVQRNWAGNNEFSPVSIERPRSVEQLCALVASSTAAGTPVRAVGARHSFSAIGSTEGMLVETDGLTAIVDVDDERRTVTVEAGIRYAQLAPTLHEHGFALRNLGSLPHLSVAGAVATATHGSGDGNQSLAGAVSSIDVVDPSGQIRRIDRGTDDGSAAIVGLGGFGVVARITLDVVPTFDVVQDVLVDLPFDAGLAQLDEILASAYSVSLFTDWSSDVFHQVWRKHRTDALFDVRSKRFGAVPARVPMHPVPGMDATACTEQLGRPGPWHTRLPHFRPDAVPSAGAELQSEYFVDRSDGVAAVDALRSLREQLAGLVLVTELRSVAADDFWLSPAFGRDSLGIHFTWRPDVGRVLAAVRQVEKVLAPFDTRPHWAKVSSTSAADLRARFPRLVDAAQRRRRLDPDGVFLNRFLEEFLDSALDGP
jgi:xylitol oxidase